MKDLLAAPIEAGKLSLTQIKSLELKAKEEVADEGKQKVKTVFRHAWKFFVENRRPDTVTVTFHISVFSPKEEESDSAEFVIDEIPTFTAAANVFKPQTEDQKLVLDSMQVQGEDGEIEVIPIGVQLGYTGSYTQIGRAGKKIGTMFGKISNSFKSGLKE